MAVDFCSPEVQEGSMKNIFAVILLFATSALAQDKEGPVAPACASRSASFDVKLDDSQHALLPPEPGKARVYFIQDLDFARCLGDCLTTRVGMDGTWIGANRQSSYFSASVEPGEHHLCVSPQSHFAWTTRYVALAHFTAEAGKVYYYRTRILEDRERRSLDFVPVDSDEAEYLIASYPMSVSHPKP
jgi:hypothetical protein